MSGGAFEYQEFHIDQIADSIEQEILNSGRLKNKEELEEDRRWYGRDNDYYKQYPEELSHYCYPDEVIVQFKEAVVALRTAYIYAHRVDYLLSGDDGNESFITRLKEELQDVRL